MANFKTHITTSTVCGIGYAGAGFYYGVSLESSLLAGGMCAVSGMLPDLDSDSGVPIREITCLAAAAIPMLLIHRLEQLTLNHEQIVLAGALIYLAIRFGASALLKRYTVHRGMFHSIPAALTFAGVAYLLCECSSVSLQLYKSGAVLLGVLSHLMLDELYAFEFKQGRVRTKKSFGTALKFFGNSLWGNLSVYGKLAIVAVLVVVDTPQLQQKLGLGGAVDAYETAAEELRIRLPSSAFFPETDTPGQQQVVQRPLPVPSGQPADPGPSLPNPKALSHLPRWQAGSGHPTRKRWEAR